MNYNNKRILGEIIGNLYELQSDCDKQINDYEEAYKQSVYKQIEYRKIAEELWKLLDNIDTATDMFKPCKENGIKSYDNFYKYCNKITPKRFDYLMSDGHKLYDKEEYRVYKENQSKEESDDKKCI